jgi:hypothetical protein
MSQLCLNHIIQPDWINLKMLLKNYIYLSSSGRNLKDATICKDEKIVSMKVIDWIRSHKVLEIILDKVDLEHLCHYALIIFVNRKILCINHANHFSVSGHIVCHEQLICLVEFNIELNDLSIEHHLIYFLFSLCCNSCEVDVAEAGLVLEALHNSFFWLWHWCKHDFLSLPIFH